MIRKEKKSAIAQSTLFILVCLLLVLALPYGKAFAVEKNPFFYLMDGEFLGGYSKIVGKNGILSTNDRWMVSPNWKITDALYWVNLYNGTFDHSSQVVAQEEGGRQTSTTQSHSLSTALKYNVSDRWSLRPLFFADWIFEQDTKDESFGNGLYDYRDIGGGIESSYIVSESQTRRDDFRLGFRYLDRTYPNYQSLISQYLVAGQAPEVHEKDFTGYKWNVSYDSQSPRDPSWGVEAIYFYKDYRDKKTIDENGILSPDKTREDFLQYYNLNASYPLSKNLSFSWDGQFAINISNLDFYDTHNTTTLLDDNFLKRYYDYFSFTAKPSLTYAAELGKDRLLTTTLSYTFYAQHYPGRKAQDAAGVYQNYDQQDYSHTFGLRVSYSLTKYVSWVATSSYSRTSSNEKFENYYLYSYDRWDVLTGFSFRY